MDGMVPDRVQVNAFAQVSRYVELSVDNRDCPLLSPGACPRCAPAGAVVTVLAPPIVEGEAGAPVTVESLPEGGRRPPTGPTLSS
jgi:hypothetical protein